jgi:8-oxo-dGTP diphosphatase
VTAAREYPQAPRVGVGAVVFRDDCVLLVRRGAPPSLGKWSIPGGLVEIGEQLQEAAAREVEEESGIEIRVGELCGVIDRVIRDEPAGNGGTGRVRFHYVIVDYVAEAIGGTLRAGGDAADARWVRLAELPQYDTTDALRPMIDRAARLRRGIHSQGEPSS